MASAPARRARWQAALACCGALLLWWRTQRPLAVAALVVTAILLAGACLFPRLYAPVQRGLDRAVAAGLAALSWGMLAVIYFGLFFPLRVLRAILGGTWLPLRHDEATSFFTPVPPHSSRRFDRQF